MGIRTVNCEVPKSCWRSPFLGKLFSCVVCEIWEIAKVNRSGTTAAPLMRPLLQLCALLPARALLVLPLPAGMAPGVAVAGVAPVPVGRKVCIRMSIDNDVGAEESARVEALVAENIAARAAKAAVAKAAIENTVELGTVDVDLSLCLNDADAEYIALEADLIFATIDADGNGAISRAELGTHLADRGHSVESIDRMFASLDSNSDGAISRQELRDGFGRFESSNLRLALGLASSSPHSRPAKRLDSGRTVLSDELFDAVDANGDNMLDVGELHDHLKGTGYSQRTIRGIFDALDINADGRISREELRLSFSQYTYSALRLALGYR